MTVDGPRSTAPDVVDVVALGESMVTFLPSVPGRLADVPSFDRAIGGAESNVACALAAAGHSVRWAGRVGADGFGDHLVEAIGAYGVDVSAVRRDPARPTGVYFRTAGDRATDAHEVAYYRAGSAASAMSVDTMDLDAVRSGRVLHLSGITPALSAGCLGLTRELTARRPGRPLVSFDVNHRPGLWRDAGDGRGPEVLLELARGADLVFVGDDEARDAWGLEGPEAVRAALPEPAVLVVKQGATGATAFHGDQVTSVPALHVDVVAAVGAGDAFAAGFLSATLRERPVRERLRHGHLWAAAALTVPGDLAVPPPARHPATAPHGASPRAESLGGPPPRRPSWIEHADRLAALDDAAWGRLRLGPGWTQDGEKPGDRAGEGADEEGRTP
ncbi:sugar kinase [Streptomyces sp. NA03103]|uniref:sugar kinase n=1 Tax=Streptomyces sp. NA03103 TaxID=2742134 RepID=UPI0015910DB0|nr:sugar kinase [Streptomyces sp. NA03103]QKW61391.1 sugar kinase [Streptomyces sp. NA03103]